MDALSQAHFDARQKWRAGEKGSLAQLKTAVGKAGTERRRQYGASVLDDLDHALSLATQFRHMATKIERERGQGWQQNLAAVRREVRDDEAEVRFNKAIAEWMIAQGWMADSPVLHITDHPGDLEIRRYWAMTKRQQRKYVKQYGDPLPIRRSWDPRYH
jgi:hypothetical protein